LLCAMTGMKFVSLPQRGTMWTWRWPGLQHVPLGVPELAGQGTSFRHSSRHR
jgi:hypothetical protein